ncbi:MAG: aldehyde dehydrogenase family protein, partial [Nanoarchaeota archaeon]
MSKITSINPATEEIYGELEETSEDEIDRKIKDSRDNKEWNYIDINNRVEIISKLVELLEQNKEKLAIIMAHEIGKPLKAGRHEIEIAKKRILDYCNLIPKFIEDEILFENNIEKNIVFFEPLGTVVVISPWNAPIFVSLAMLIPPMLCGNNVIWKPSEYASFSGLKLAELFDELKKDGLP